MITEIAMSGYLAVVMMVVLVIKSALKEVPPEKMKGHDPLEDLPQDITDEIIEKTAKRITEKRFSFPLNLFHNYINVVFEILSPLNFIGSQTILLAGPFAKLFTSEDEVNTMSAFLRKRDNVKRLTERIEQLIEQDKTQVKKRGNE